MTQKQIYFLFIVMMALFINAPAVYAVAIDLNKIPPLAAVELLPREQFEKQTAIYEQTPYEDEYLAFQVRLPKEWQEGNAQLSAIKSENPALSQSVLGVVARYISPVNNHRRSFFTVEAVELVHEIGTRDWFIQYLLKSGLSLEQVGSETEGEVEALYVEVQGDQTYIVRVKVMNNGPRMVIARHYVPMEIYHEEKQLQTQVINSFELINKHDGNIEELKIHGFLDQSFMNYPKSWILSAPRVRSVERMQAMIYHRDAFNNIQGQINFYLTAKSLGTNRSDEIKYYRDKFQIEGYTLGKLIEKTQIPYHEQTTFGVTQVYEMNSDNPSLSDYELWISVLENEEYYYIISLLTPYRHGDFYTWARNSATYKLVVGNVRATDESLDYYQFIQ